MTQTKRVYELEVGDVIAYFNRYRTVRDIDEKYVYLIDSALRDVLQIGKRSQENVAYLGNCKREKIKL